MPDPMAMTKNSISNAVAHYRQTRETQTDKHKTFQRLINGDARDLTFEKMIIEKSGRVIVCEDQTLYGVRSARTMPG